MTSEPTGVVWAFEVVSETDKNLTARRLLDGALFNFSKTPKKYFGDALNGPFSTPAAAEAKLRAPLPIFVKENKQWYRQ